MRWMAGLVGGLWRIARASWVDVGGGLRPGSGASALYLFLFLVFLIVGGVLQLLGVSLEDADRWIDRQAGWLDALGGILLRIVFGLVFLGCVATVAGGLVQRLPLGRGKRPPRRRAPAAEDGRIGWGGMLLALVVGYFAAIGAFGRY